MEGKRSGFLVGFGGHFSGANLLVLSNFGRLLDLVVTPQKTNMVHLKMKSLEEEIPITKPSFFRVENVSFRGGVLILVAFFSLQKDGYVLAAWLVAPLPHLQGPSASVLVMSNLFPTPPS